MAAAGRSHTEVEYTDLLAEYQRCKKKLDNKVEALLLVSQDLGKCQTARDRANDLCEFLESRVNDLEAILKTIKEQYARKETAATEERDNLLSMLQSARRENRLLLEENVSLRQQRKDAKGDIKVLRQKLAQQQLHEYYSPSEDVIFNPSTPKSRHGSEASGETSVTHRSDPGTGEGCLEDMERMTEKYGQLELDLRSILCEKEELVCEKETYKNKCDRLTTELAYIMNGDERRVVSDLDGVLAENRYLKAQLEHAHEETGLARAALNRYRSLIEKRKKHTNPSGPGSIVSSVEQNLNAGPPTRSSGLTFVTPKQIRELLGDSCGSVDGQTDYKALSCALFDAVNDKNLALTHQRKANKILGVRITELEARIRTLEAKSPVKLLSPPSDPVAAQPTQIQTLPNKLELPS